MTRITPISGTHLQTHRLPKPHPGAFRLPARTTRQAGDEDLRGHFVDIEV